ncbi:hypothetical protein BCR36DRAFT_581013, partial [Piromyces finnis]
MKKFNIFFIFINVITVTFGYTLKEVISNDNLDPIQRYYRENGMKLDREDVVIDIENQNITTNKMTVTYLYPDDHIVRTPEHSVCISSKNCVLVGNPMGPFKYYNLNCYIHSFSAGPNDYYELGNGYKDFNYSIDVNGYLQCVYKNFKLNIFRRVNVKGFIGPVTASVAEENFTKWASYYKNKKLVDGKNQLNYNKLKMTITISTCSSVFSFKTNVGNNICDVDGVIEMEKGEDCMEYVNVVGVTKVFICGSGLCCGKNKKCGKGSSYCGKGCLSRYGTC